MSSVSLDVGGRRYKVACADGEEAHVQRLAGVVDAKLAAMGGNRAPSDAQNLLFAALMLADELETSGGTAPAPAQNEAERIAQTLESLADRMEKCALLLEGGRGAP